MGRYAKAEMKDGSTSLCVLRKGIVMGRPTISIIFLLLASASPGLAGNTDLASRLKAKMESVRIREYPPEITITDEQLRAADPNQLLAVLAPYGKDPEWPVRHAAYAYMVRVATIHPVARIREEVVRRLVDAVYSGIGHNEGPWLLRFTAKDFDDRSRNAIRQALSREPVSALTVQLCGVANIQDQLPRLEGLLIDEVAYISDPKMRHFPKWYYTLGWDARLARARLGVKEDITRCIELAEREKNATERVLRILPQIGYIRQPEAIEYLRKYLESNDRLPPTNPGMPGRSYASWVMDILAQSLQGYPVKQKPAGNYTEQEIKVCRKWMANKANWRIIR
jgi:hypothetical protein